MKYFFRLGTRFWSRRNYSFKFLPIFFIIEICLEDTSKLAIHVVQTCFSGAAATWSSVCKKETSLIFLLTLCIKSQTLSRFGRISGRYTAAACLQDFQVDYSSICRRKVWTTQSLYWPVLFRSFLRLKMSCKGGVEIDLDE